MHTALTIAGSDPSGGAGLQGDLKTFHSHGVYGMAVVTALTVQNTRGVQEVYDVPAEFVGRQLRAVLDDMPVGAAKTGMLSRSDVITEVATVLRSKPPPYLVIDPVMVASSGDPLLHDDAVETLVAELFPLASIVTPNFPEAERLVGRKIEREEREDAIAEIVALGARAVLLKGGHMRGDDVLDLLYDGERFEEFRQPRIDTRHTHGTGCALAAALAARLAHGETLRDATSKAILFVRRGLACGVPLGAGVNPLNHLAGSA
ncbi:MAG: bifunctional hydroxymethylpyrimidine kinase/phosphomethylpyrimidine kinase [Planctomycetota bacterium]